MTPASPAGVVWRREGVVLGTVTGLILLAAVRTGTPDQTAAAFLVALTVAILERFTIRLDPWGQLSLRAVMTIPTLVLFGWQPAVVGSAVGIATCFIARSSERTWHQILTDVPALAIGAVLAATVRIWGVPLEIGYLVLTSCAYFLSLLLLDGWWMATSESIGITRAISFLGSAFGLHPAVFTVLAVASVVVAEGLPWPAGRLAVPMLTSAVGVQIYLHRILRGREQHRVLAAVALLARAVDAKDAQTGDHSTSVAELARRTARLIGLDEPAAHRVYLSGLLHDVGKIVVPQEILLKPGPLTPEERTIMQDHVLAGAEMLQSIGGLSEIAPIVAASHEHYDGKGYPHGLKGEEIPIAARINLAVDAFSAMTSERPYRKPRSPDVAIKEIEAHAGTQFDIKVVQALRAAVDLPSRHVMRKGLPPWFDPLRRPAFALLWIGEFVSFLGDEVFFIALALWVYQLTKSATLLALTLLASSIGQGFIGLFAGVLVDRVDRRAVLIVTDIGRALLIAALALVLPHSLPLGLVLLLAANVGTVFFTTGLRAIIPAVVPSEELLTANALIETSARIAEVLGGVLGSVLVVVIGYQMVFFLNAVSFLGSAVGVALMPLAWRIGLRQSRPPSIGADILEGLRYIWHTPVQRFLAFLILPGYATLGFVALNAPMVIKTAHLGPVAFGVTNSVLGAGKLAAAVLITALGARLVSERFVAAMFFLVSASIALFGLTTLYPVFIVAAFAIGFGNMASSIGNATISMANAPLGILGRVMASRQAFIQMTKAVSMLAVARVADVVGPPVALIALALVTGGGIALVWGLVGRRQFPTVPLAWPGVE